MDFFIIFKDTYTKIPENTTKNNIDELKISTLSKLQENTSKSISMDWRFPPCQNSKKILQNQYRWIEDSHLIITSCWNINSLFWPFDVLFFYTKVLIYAVWTLNSLTNKNEIPDKKMNYHDVIYIIIHRLKIFMGWMPHHLSQQDTSGLAF